MYIACYTISTKSAPNYTVHQHLLKYIINMFTIENELAYSCHCYFMIDSFIRQINMVLFTYNN